MQIQVKVCNKKGNWRNSKIIIRHDKEKVLLKIISYIIWY